MCHRNGIIQYVVFRDCFHLACFQDSSILQHVHILYEVLIKYFVKFLIDFLLKYCYKSSLYILDTVFFKVYVLQVFSSGLWLALYVSF